MSIQAKNIRNIVFAGHASKGKTTLCEALLNVAGTTERMGKTADANTVLDFDSEEKKRKIEWKRHCFAVSAPTKAKPLSLLPMSLSPY